MAVTFVTTAVAAVAITALAGYLNAALWMLVSVLVVAAILRVASRSKAAFVARSTTFDVAFIALLVIALLLVIPYANLPSPV